MNNKGYSVFEVLVAFAIMAMVLAALLPGQAKLLARAKSSDETALAYDYAFSRLSRLGVSEPIPSAEQSFEFTDWVVKESALQLPDSNNRHEITVRILDVAGAELAVATTVRRIEK